MTSALIFLALRSGSLFLIWVGILSATTNLEEIRVSTLIFALLRRDLCRRL